ncbi:hypothetical protein FB45DRAFT_859080 [Roridomyces roridus]|uniref:Uncharacterized protein n=1 Tax=Roridomyces roridus TaxID=1738132 RepID=A0AAD7CIS7_9AGAR|nr:hypothetical protein FB45DRAFT_859080 [Roridomyces roridus]
MSISDRVPSTERNHATKSVSCAEAEQFYQLRSRASEVLEVILGVKWRGDTASHSILSFPLTTTSVPTTRTTSPNFAVSCQASLSRINLKLAVNTDALLEARHAPNCSNAADTLSSPLVPRLWPRLPTVARGRHLKSSKQDSPRPSSTRFKTVKYHKTFKTSKHHRNKTLKTFKFVAAGEDIKTTKPSQLKHIETCKHRQLRKINEDVQDSKIDFQYASTFSKILQASSTVKILRSPGKFLHLQDDVEQELQVVRNLGEDKTFEDLQELLKATTPQVEDPQVETHQLLCSLARQVRKKFIKSQEPRSHRSTSSALQDLQTLSRSTKTKMRLSRPTSPQVEDPQAASLSSLVRQIHEDDQDTALKTHLHYASTFHKILQGLQVQSRFRPLQELQASAQDADDETLRDLQTPEERKTPQVEDLKHTFQVDWSTCERSRHARRFKIKRTNRSLVRKVCKKFLKSQERRSHRQHLKRPSRPANTVKIHEDDQNTALKTNLQCASTFNKIPQRLLVQPFETFKHRKQRRHRKSKTPSTLSKSTLSNLQKLKTSKTFRNGSSAPTGFKSASSARYLASRLPTGFKSHQDLDRFPSRVFLVNVKLQNVYDELTGSRWFFASPGVVSKPRAPLSWAPGLVPRE